MYVTHRRERQEPRSLLNYVLDGVGAHDIQQALGVSAATYYRRKAQDDYPNAEELRLDSPRVVVPSTSRAVDSLSITPPGGATDSIRCAIPTCSPMVV